MIWQIENDDDLLVAVIHTCRCGGVLPLSSETNRVRVEPGACNRVVEVFYVRLDFVQGRVVDETRNVDFSVSMVILFLTLLVFF